MKSYNLIVNDREYQVLIKEADAHSVKVEVDGVERVVGVTQIRTLSIPRMPSVSDAVPFRTASVIPVATQTKSASSGAGSVPAPIPGLVKQIFVREGQEVLQGEKLLMMEAMKMENQIVAPFAGKILKIAVKEGETVNQEQLLLEIGGK